MSQEELEQAVALLYRRFRDPVVPETELTKMISLTLTWAKPSQAPHLLARAVRAGLLERHEDGFEITFDPGEVELPFGFKPSDGLFEETPMPAATATADTGTDDASTSGGPTTETVQESPGETVSATEDVPAGETLDQGQRPLVEELLDRLAEHGDVDRKAAVASVNSKQDALGGKVSMEAAALIVAAEDGLAVDELALRVLEDLGVDPPKA